MKRITPGEYEQRVGALQRALSESDLDGYLVTSRDHMFYLTGLVCDPLERPFFLLVKPEGSPTCLVPALEETHIKGKYNENLVDVYWEYPAPAGDGWSDRLPEFLEGVNHLGVDLL